MRRRGGFTVVELLITMVVLLLILGSLGAMLISGSTAYGVTAQRSESLQDSEAVLQLLRYEIGLAGYRGLESGTFDRSFTLDGAAKETIEIEPHDSGDRLTVRYFEDRYLGTGDTGERRVSYFVDPKTHSLNRIEKNPVDGELESEMMVGNIAKLEVVDLVDLQRNTVAIADIRSNPANKPAVVAGIQMKVELVDGDQWDLLIGLANSQIVSVK